jgi:hypothetical protein
VFGIISLCLAILISIANLDGYLNKDSDGDGIRDRYDKCKYEKGDTSNNGCPLLDSDEDGVEDEYDNCPDEIGEVDNNGCPWPDTDEDGVFDKDDDCPSTFGKGSDGCPLNGSAVFWIQYDEADNWIGNCSIYIDGSYEGEIDGWYGEVPDCGSRSCVTIEKSPGTYSYLARWDDGQELRGTVEISENECVDKRFSYE